MTELIPSSSVKFSVKTVTEKFSREHRHFTERLQYALKEMDYTKGCWKHAVWIGFFERGNGSWDDLSYFLESFSYLLNFEE